MSLRRNKPRARASWGLPRPGGSGRAKHTVSLPHLPSWTTSKKPEVKSRNTGQLIAGVGLIMLSIFGCSAAQTNTLKTTFIEDGKLSDAEVNQVLGVVHFNI